MHLFLQEKKHKKHKKDKKKKSKKEKHDKKASASSSLAVDQNEFGKYGVIREEHFYQKQKEFEVYMSEVKDLPGAWMNKLWCADWLLELIP